MTVINAPFQWFCILVNDISKSVQRTIFTIIGPKLFYARHGLCCMFNCRRTIPLRQISRCTVQPNNRLKIVRQRSIPTTRLKFAKGALYGENRSYWLADTTVEWKSNRFISYGSFWLIEWLKRKFFHIMSILVYVLLAIV